MDRWEALSGFVNAAILFVPVFVSIFCGLDRLTKLRTTARDRRIAAYRMSPHSRLLILND